MLACAGTSSVALQRLHIHVPAPADFNKQCIFVALPISAVEEIVSSHVSRSPHVYEVKVLPPAADHFDSVVLPQFSTSFSSLLLYS